MSNITIFRNEIFGEIRRMLLNNKPYFVGKDVATILGYSNPTKAVSMHCKNGIKEIIPTKNRKEYSKARNAQTMILIPENDLYRLIQKSKTKSEIYKNNFISWLLNEKLIKDNILVVETRDEIEFLDKLEESFKPFNIKGIRQYNVLTYRIDYYIPKLKIAIEYDENDHKNYTYEQHELRQKDIEKELGCEFIRISDNNTDAYNIGLILKEITRKEVA